MSDINSNSSTRVYSFKDVVGNFSTVSVIKSSIRNNTFPNFTLMSGDSGTGKSTVAEIVALALNCKARVDENPCLKCEDCRTNLNALQDRGSSTRVKKVNLGKANEKQDVDNLITEIFKLDVSSGKSVFILEEVHSLSEIRQTALLEEIDKLDENVHVILCTTRPRKLLEELRNRSIKFNFSSLKSTDSRILLDKLLAENHYSMSTSIKDLILKQAKGTPRVIVNLLHFLKDNPCDYNTILEFLGEINPRHITMLIKSAYETSSYYSYLTELLSDYSTDTLLIAMKNYFMDLQFLSMGVSTHYSHTTQEDKLLANELGREYIYKIQTVLHSMKGKPEECDFIFNMLKIQSLIVKSSKKEEGISKPITTSPSLGEADLKNSIIFDNSEKVNIDSRLKDMVMSNPSAIENHINAVEKRDSIRSHEDSALKKLDLNRFKELLR